ncbi:hypothetical protein Asp14428_56760 [Actinoplanes sp. NBRC 14428]|nr:hypothetical protein Asp14428_56760 [Actinoplanes sp. NBRC 14428]
MSSQTGLSPSDEAVGGDRVPSNGLSDALIRKRYAAFCAPVTVIDSVKPQPFVAAVSSLIPFGMVTSL